MNGKVLVVDDKQIMRDSVGATLQRAGMQIVSASDGQAALTAIARHRPDAVISDLKMPELDGLGLLMKLKEVDDHWHYARAWLRSELSRSEKGRDHE